MLKSQLLKIAIFATGLSGIVAEYILSTLASYFLGDSVFQWTLIVSIMLFSMGLGSRISKNFNTNLIAKFIYIELILSLLVSFAAILVYAAAAFTLYDDVLIYGLCIGIGLLIGMEIPLVVRINESSDQLHVNIASVLENDYYGSLLGGLFFAFVGLPIIGLTYTPLLLGGINLIVAVFLFFYLRKEIGKKTIQQLQITVYTVILIWGLGVATASPIITYGEQIKYRDKVVFSKQTRYQKIVMTQWKNNHWLYINGNQQLSTVDEVMYHEPLVHPIMQLAKKPQNILVLGGGDGCAVREILKYPSVKQIHLIDLDKEMTRLGQNNSILNQLNQNSLNHPKVKITNQDAFTYLQELIPQYDIIIIDLPDPRSIALNRLYSKEFYHICKRLLRPNGLMITQAGSPYFASEAYQCIDNTLKSCGFNTLRMHNQIITMGQWGWILAGKNPKFDLRKNFLKIKLNQIKTKWITQDALSGIISFGKDIFGEKIEDINQIHDPKLYQYYLKGSWDLY